jgi:hypothetical protein
MLSVFIVVKLNEDDSIDEIVSAHPNRPTAVNAERFYRSMNRTQDFLRTDIREVEFGA